MKITGTKKLIIIFLSLVCAFAAGLGVLFTADVSTARASTYPAAQSVADLPEEDGSTIEREMQKEQEEDNFVAPDFGNGENADNAGENADNANVDADNAESEYDERYNEDAVRSVAEILGIEFKLVNLYVHVNEIDANELLVLLLEDREQEEEIPETMFKSLTPEEAEAEEKKAEEEHECEDGHECEDESFMDELFSDLDEFKNSYAAGEYVSENIDENSDWYIAPDEVNDYAYNSPTVYIGYNNITLIGVYTFSKAFSSNTIYYNAANAGNCRGAWDMGRECTVNLNYGETFRITYKLNTSSNTGQRSTYQINTHMQDVGVDPVPTNRTSTWWVIDGDAPTGTVFYVAASYAGWVTNNYYNYFYSPLLNSSGTNSSTAYKKGSCKFFTYKITVIRSDPPKPTLVQEDGLTSEKRKTDYYYGEPVTISFYPDYGAGLLYWSSDDGVELKSRSRHGATITNLVVESSVAGTHVITLTSFSGKWADGTSGPVEFTLEVLTQTTAQPTMRREAGVATNGKSKTVHDNGGYQTVTFENADKNFVSWSSDGLLLDSWTDNGVLTLRQKEQGTYTINLYITNPAGCTWDNGRTDRLQFTFSIKEMYIEKPIMSESPGSKSKIVDYTGEAQTLVLSPAIQSRLVIVTAGLDTNFTDEDGDGELDSVVFSMTDSGTVNIIITPDKGYVWQDGTTSQVVFTFTINAVYVSAPKIETGPGVSGNMKTVTFDPADGWYATLTITNIPKDAIKYTTALTEVSWGEDDILVLRASNALLYYVTFELTSTNYRWAAGTIVPTFMLNIERYALKAPYIIYDNDEDKIEGDTKTVHFTDPDTQKFFKLYAGGFSRRNQILLDYSVNIDGRELSEQWDTAEPKLTLWGEHAANYIINITPTSNYCWDVGAPDSEEATAMVTFKFVINAIQKDNLTMYVDNNGQGWSAANTREGTADYDGTAKFFRIGAEDRQTEWFNSSDMQFFVVDQSYNIVQNSELKCVKGSNSNYYNILEFTATNAGTYIVMLQLKDTDYAWRDGSGVNVYYTFIIKAQPVGTPVIIDEECGGYKLEVYDTYIYGVYDSNNFTLAINVKAASYITVILDPYDNDPDDSTVNGKGIWQFSRSEGTDYDRLVLQSVNQGTHVCRLRIDDPNFCWDENVPYYEFKIIIDYAEVSGVTFYYEYDGEERELGGDLNVVTYYNNANFITDGIQNIIVRRSDETEFTNTSFNNQFTYEITSQNGNYVTTNANGNNVAVDGSMNFGKSQLTLGFYHADMYTIRIYLTSNYKWADSFLNGVPCTCMFQIRPKTVELPTIQESDEQDASINDFTRTKTVTYDRTNRKIVLELGDDWKAFEVEESMNSDGLTRDTSNAYRNLFVYQAKDAFDKYELVVKLSNTNDYQWPAGTNVRYYLHIRQRPVDLPTAYLIDAETVAEWVAAQIQNTITAEMAQEAAGGAPMTEFIRPEVSYVNKNNPYRVYLYGEAVQNTDVIVDIIPFDKGNSNLVTKGEVAEHSVKTGYYCAASQVNVYSVNMTFVLNQFGEPNCCWLDSGLSGDRNFEFEIIKMVVNVPYIVDGDSDELEDDSYYKSFVYDVTLDEKGNKIAVPRTVTIADCLSAEFDLMRYSSDDSLTGYGSFDSENGTIEFFTRSGANVGIDYVLTISLDTPNQRWNIDGDDDNISPKKYHIVIEKYGVKAPTILHDDPDAEYDDVSKSVFYDGSRRIDELTIEGLGAYWLTYKMATPLTMESVYNDPTLVVSTSSEAGTYTVVVSLSDPANLKWDGTDDDSDDLGLSLIVKPSPIDKPVVDKDACIGNYDDIDDPFPDDITMVVTYTGETQYISIKNFLFHDENGLMKASIISSGKFTESDYSDVTALLTYGAKNVGEYVVQITLSSNAEWSDGSGSDPVNITLRIEKIKYNTPFIVDDGDETATITDFSKTVTYILNTKQVIEIDEYDNRIMRLWETTSTSTESLTYNVDPDTGYYWFKAENAGTYTITFRLDDFTNTRWKYADNETVKFTFIIEKLTLATPQIDHKYDLKQDTVTDTSLKTVYDARSRAVVVNNIRDVNYIQYAPAENYNTSGTTRFVYDTTAVESSYLTDEARYLSVKEVLGYTEDHTFKRMDVNLDTDVENENYVTLKASQPGTYIVNFKITDPSNMRWADEAPNATAGVKSITLTINKMQCAAPSINGSDKAQYTGKYIEFKVKDAYNGRDTEDDYINDVVTTFEYETCSVNPAVSDVQGAKMEIVSWYGGNLILRATEVGSYSVTINIKNPDTTEWTNTSATSRTLNFTIEKKDIAPVITYGSDDATYTGGNKWAISTSVYAKIAFNNICVREDGKLDINFAAEINFVKKTDLNLKYRTTIAVPADEFATATDSMVSTKDPRWELVKNANGTFSLIFTYTIPSGTDNITKGTFYLNAVQNGDSGNYNLKTQKSEFNIVADRAPFDESNLVWQYVIDNDPDATVHTFTLDDLGLANWKGNSNKSDPIKLDYLINGGAYVFNIFMNDDGMAGHDGKGYERFDAALLSWEVKWDGIYGGKQSATYAGNYYVSIKITAKDADYYSFDDTVYTLWFTINPVLYDLSDLKWDYDGTPFTFDGTAKSVKLIGSLPSGLTVSTYLVTGYDLNTQIYAGKYKTALVFATSNKNYELPDMNNPDSYYCTDAFPWEIEWEIEKAELEVKWKKAQSSDGSSLAYVPILAEHGEKVTYTYYKWMGIDGWVETNSFAHSGEEKFRVEAYLKEDLNNPATNYKNNYILKFVEEDDPDQYWTDFTLGGDVSYIGINVFVGWEKEVDEDTEEVTYIGGTQLVSGNDPENIQNKFGYTGKPFEARMEMFFEPSGAITLDNIILTYYSAVNYNKPLAGAPTNAGTYKIKLTLVNIPENGIEYELSDKEFYFTIELGTFDPELIYWQYTHTDTNGNITKAKWDENQGDEGKWILTSYWDEANQQFVTDNVGEEVIFSYDGLGHTVELISEDDRLVIRNKSKAYINAGTYTTVATFSYDGTKWNPPAVDSTKSWTIEKAVIDLSTVEWSYTGDFVYTLSGGKAKQYSIELKDLHEYLLDYVSYITTKDGVSVGNRVSDAGEYITTVYIADLPETSNYKLGEWPEHLEKSYRWEIFQREIAVPEAVDSDSAGYWPAFDGLQHDLLAAITKDYDWSEYYGISVKYAEYTDSGFAAAKNYDGTKDYGYQYSAFNAGKYTYTFTIDSAINKTVTNVVWVYEDASGTNVTTADARTYDMEVRKAAMRIDSWNEDLESSTVNLSGEYVSDKFIDYRFYRGTDKTGEVVGLDVVISSLGHEFFTISPYVKAEYGNNITLTWAANCEYYTFETLELSTKYEDQQIIPKNIFITGYKMDGVYHEFTRDEWKEMLKDVLEVDEETTEEEWDELLTSENKAKATVYVTYSGKPVTFVLNLWDMYYVNHLDLWTGNLTQSEAGAYSATLIFKRDTAHPRCWSAVDNGDGTYTYDRSSITFNFQLRYLMLTIPQIKDVTYTGADINIIQSSLGDELFDKLLTEYGDYVSITGEVGTAAGSYKLYLMIKEEYVNTIRWNNGTPFGQPGTYTINWTILPIYIEKPVPNTDPVIYDGSEHSVFEKLVGYYGDEGMSEALQGLMQNARISAEGSRAINAGTYVATFSLPDSNYAWIDSVTGVVDDAVTSLNVTWELSRKELDLSGVYWGYVDQKGEVRKYDKNKPLQYTYENGQVFSYALQLCGIPEELEEYITYLTDGEKGNSRSAIGTYKMLVFYFSNEIDAGNYSVGQLPLDFTLEYGGTDSDLEITWQIVQRQFTVPDDKEVYFDGSVRDLLDMLGFEDGWENYLDVTVQYKKLDWTDDEYIEYMDIAEIDELLGYSVYNAYYLGSYRLNLFIKTGMNSGEDRVVWLNGGNALTADQQVTLTINPLIVKIDGWNDNYQYSTVKADLPEDISPDALDLFEYVIRDYDSGEIVSAEDVETRGSGYSYTIEFRVKPENEYAAKTGIILDFADGVDKEYLFGIYNFVYDKVTWVPIPVLDKTSLTFRNEELEFKINNWVENYVISDEFKTKYPDYEIDSDTFIYAIGSNAGLLDTSNGKLKAVKAGDYKVTVRFNPSINLSWYDSTKYKTDANGNLVDLSTGSVVTNTEKLVNRYAQTISFKVEKASVAQIDVERLQEMLPTLEYNGLTYNLKDLSQCATLFNTLERLYGSLIVIEGYEGMESGEHDLVISLADPESSYWNLEEVVTETIKVKGYELRWVFVNGRWKILYVRDNGDGTYTEYDGNYNTDGVVYKTVNVIDEYVLIGEGENSLLNEDGTPKQQNVYEVYSNGVAVRYKKLNDGTYEMDANGDYIAKFKLDASGNIVTTPALDSNFNLVIDNELSVITTSYVKQSTDPYTLKWYISASTRSAPYVHPDKELVYNGREQSVEDILANYDPLIMEIVEGGTATDAGAYVAKIVLKGDNYTWADGLDCVYVTWTIEKANVDLSGVSWGYIDENGEYQQFDAENPVIYTYTRENGAAVSYGVTLLNLPEELQSSIRYTTNGVVGSYSGANAGKYLTTFEIVNMDSNFGEVVISDEMQTTISWYIQKRVLEVPELEGSWTIFDDEVHNLLDMLDLPEGWDEYFDITITYSNGNSPFMEYEGYDDGNGLNKYLAYGSGLYRYYLTIKTGLNTSAANPNVVWQKTVSEN